MRLIDSHCHLNYPGLVERQAEVLEQAARAGVSGMLAIGTKRDEWPQVLALANAHKHIWCTLGIHPHEADSHSDLTSTELAAAATQAPRVVGLGETGLDYYYDHSDRKRQQDNFRAHIQAARLTGLPLVIHTRDAEEDTCAILQEEMQKGAFGGVIHCFTASQALADFVLALGFYISLSGIVTFKSARALQETARRVPLDRLLVETDAPFLAPVPMRGRTCEPAYVRHTLKFLSALRGIDEGELAQITSDNFFTLFDKAQERPV
jgi:TatD DNase family protein